MKISTWRAGLKTFLQKYLTVTTWEMDNPIQPSETVGVLPPLTHWHYSRNGNSVLGSATQVIELISRIDGTLGYDNLPIGLYEGIYSTVAYRLLVEYSSIADVYQLQMMEHDPIAIAERDDARGDWFIRVQWMFNVQWVAELETGTVGTPYDLNRILLRLDRGLVPVVVDDLVKPERYIVDTVITID